LPCHGFVVDALVGQELVRVFVQGVCEFGCEVARDVPDDVVLTTARKLLMPNPGNRPVCRKPVGDVA